MMTLLGIAVGVSLGLSAWACIKVVEANRRLDHLAIQQWIHDIDNKKHEGAGNNDNAPVQ